MHEDYRTGKRVEFRQPWWGWTRRYERWRTYYLKPHEREQVLRLGVAREIPSAVEQEAIDERERQERRDAPPSPPPRRGGSDGTGKFIAGLIIGGMFGD